jgi:hypothetical protein
MATSDPTHPLGHEDSDQIDPAVAQALTPYEIQWLRRQCDELNLKKLQILRQALIEWIGEHPEYRFYEDSFGDTMRIALEKFIETHSQEFVPVEADHSSDTAGQSEHIDRSRHS